MLETRSNAPLATPKPELAVVARLAGVAVALLGGVMLLLALAAAWRISQHAAHTRDRILPNILDNQRTIVNVERLHRFTELAHVSTDRQTRRAALHTAEALAQAMSFESDARLADTVKAVFKNLRAMARQKDEQDRLKENMELLGRDIEETGISMIKGLVAKSGRVTAPNPSECREPRAYLLSRRALEATDFSTPNSVRVAWNEFQVQQRDVQRSSRCLDDAAAADIPDPLAFVDRAAAMFVLRLEYLQTITNVDDLWRASTTSIEALSASLTVSAAKATADSFTAIEVKAQQAMLVLSVVIAGSFLLMLALRAFILRHILRPVRDASQALEAIERTGYSPALLPARIKEFDLVNRGVERLAVMIEQVAQRSHDLEAEIVERKRVEEKLRASEEDYRSIFANALTGIYRSRYSDGLFLEANDRAAQFFGYPSRESFVGKVRAADRYFDPEDRERFLAHLEAHGAVEHFEARFRRLDGSIGWILYSGKLHRERGYIEGVMTDITARKKAEEQLANLNHHLEDLVSARTEALVRQAQELEAANRRLLELDEMKSSFLSSVSHELRTPLTSIFGFALCANEGETLAG